MPEATETIHERFSRFVPLFTQEAMTAYGAGDYSETLNKLQKVTELVRAALIIEQLTRRA